MTMTVDLLYQQEGAPLPIRPPVDVSQFRSDVDQALAAILVDPGIACKIAKRATWIKRRRAIIAEQKARESERRVPV